MRDDIFTNLLQYDLIAVFDLEFIAYLKGDITCKKYILLSCFYFA